LTASWAVSSALSSAFLPLLYPCWTRRSYLRPLIDFWLVPKFFFYILSILQDIRSRLTSLAFSRQFFRLRSTARIRTNRQNSFLSMKVLKFRINNPLLLEAGMWATIYNFILSYDNFIFLSLSSVWVDICKLIGPRSLPKWNYYVKSYPFFRVDYSIKDKFFPYNNTRMHLMKQSIRSVSLPTK
jgi:hypothetical protein